MSRPPFALGEIWLPMPSGRLLHAPLDSLTKDLPENSYLYKLAQCQCFLKGQLRPLCRYRVFIQSLSRHGALPEVHRMHLKHLEKFFMDIFMDSDSQFIKHLFALGSSHVKVLWISCYMDDGEYCSSSAFQPPLRSKIDPKLLTQNVIAAVIFHCNPGKGACIRYIGTSAAVAGSSVLSDSKHFREFEGGTIGLWRDGGPKAFRGIGLGQFLIHLVQVHTVFDIKTYSSSVYLSATFQGEGWYRRMGFREADVEQSWPECYVPHVGNLEVLTPMMTTMPIPPIKKWNHICKTGAIESIPPHGLWVNNTVSRKLNLKITRDFDRYFFLRIGIISVVRVKKIGRRVRWHADRNSVFVSLLTKFSKPVFFVKLIVDDADRPNQLTNIHTAYATPL